MADDNINDVHANSVGRKRGYARIYGEYGQRTRQKHETHPQKKKKPKENEMSQSLLTFSLKDLSYGDSSSEDLNQSAHSDCSMLQNNLVGSSSISKTIENSIPNDSENTESDEDESSDVNIAADREATNDTPEMINVKTKKEWGDDIVLHSQEDVDKFAEDEGFIKLSTNRSSDGEAIYYRCIHVLKKHAQSCKTMKVFKSFRKMDFIVSVSIGEHCHSTATQPKTHMKKPDLLEYVYSLRSADGMKPRKIKEHLKRNRPDEKTPTIRQIRYMLKSMERKNIPSTFSYGELIEWLKTQTSVPVTLDEAFVVDWFYEKTDDSFAFVVSTRRLLRNAIKEKNVSGDGTYKIIWQKFPIIVIGMVDRENHFHIIAVVVTSNERASEYGFVFRTIRMGVERETNEVYKPETIISDHAAAIRNGFFAVFGPSDNVICSVHMFRKLQERSGYSSKENKKSIIDDVHILHSSSDRGAFDCAVSLFLEKWEGKDKDFCTYFKSTWLGEYTRNWYRGYSPFVPDHNNAIEGTNLSIKRDFTLRELIPFNTFKKTVIDMVHQMSLRYDGLSEDIPKRVALVPKLTKKLHRGAYTWIANSPSVMQITQDDKYIGYLAANFVIAPTDMLALRNKTYQTFDDYKKDAGKLQLIKFCNDKTKWIIESVCSCQEFQRNFICKHLLGLAFHNKLKKCVEEGNNKLIAKNSKKGRIPLAKKALERQ